MKNLCIPVLALVIGFANACFAFQVHSLFFCLVPLWAFAFGYFSSWKTGLLSGFLLFASYTSAVSLLTRWAFEPIDYPCNFFLGGFLLLLIGCGAPMAKRGVRNFRAVGVLVILVLLVSWCGYIALPRCTYYYQVGIRSSDGLNDLELYLPVGAISREPYEKIFDHPWYDMGSGVLEDYSLELLDSEYGQMLKLGIPRFKEGHKLLSEYGDFDIGGSVIFMQSNAPHEKLRFLSRYEASETGEVRSERFVGPFRTKAQEITEQFKVPIKVSSGKETAVELSLSVDTWRRMGISFANEKSEGYSERLKPKLQTVTGDEWVFAEAEAKRSIRGGGMGD